MSTSDLFWLAALVMLAPHADKTGGMVLGLAFFLASIYFRGKL